MAPIRDALVAAGYFPVFECEARACGGFEFRFALDVAPPPEMYVDLGDYRFLAAQRVGPEGETWRLVLASRTADRGFLQLTAVTPAPEARDVARPGTRAEREEGAGSLGTTLSQEGRAVLEGVTFETGSAALGPGESAALEHLAGYLREAPEARVVLVGHTDAEGGLAANIELSRQRAEAVRARLIEAHGIAPGRVTAEGVGFLAPRATNATEAGRERNRRVEVVLVGPF
jgi:OOP family OmpA-OmpF porin